MSPQSVFWRRIMLEKKIVIRNKAGIHCRPSSIIISEKENFPETAFKVIAESGTTDLNGILELLALGLQSGDEITLQVSGGNEESALEAMKALFEKEFDFPDA